MQNLKQHLKTAALCTLFPAIALAVFLLANPQPAVTQAVGTVFQTLVWPLQFAGTLLSAVFQNAAFVWVVTTASAVAIAGVLGTFVYKIARTMGKGKTGAMLCAGIGALSLIAALPFLPVVFLLPTAVAMVLAFFGSNMMPKAPNLDDLAAFTLLTLAAGLIGSLPFLFVEMKTLIAVAQESRGYAAMTDEDRRAYEAKLTEEVDSFLLLFPSDVQQARSLWDPTTIAAIAATIAPTAASAFIPHMEDGGTLSEEGRLCTRVAQGKITLIDGKNPRTLTDAIALVACVKAFDSLEG